MGGNETTTNKDWGLLTSKFLREMNFWFVVVLLLTDRGNPENEKFLDS